MMRGMGWGWVPRYCGP